MLFISCGLLRLDGVMVKALAYDSRGRELAPGWSTVK